MKILSDFFPILLFFIAYKLYDVYVATAVMIVTSLIQVVVFWIRHRRLEKMQLIVLLSALVLGGATLLLKDPTFVKWKTTVVSWLFAVAFLASQYLGRKPILQHMMGNNIELPGEVWSRLNIGWAMFFILLGAINLYVAYHFDMDTWVNFKLFGTLGLTLLFVFGQAFYLSRHLKSNQEAE